MRFLVRLLFDLRSERRRHLRVARGGNFAWHRLAQRPTCLSLPCVLLVRLAALDAMGRVGWKNLFFSVLGRLVLVGGRTIVETHARYAGASHCIWLGCGLSLWLVRTSAALLVSGTPPMRDSGADSDSVCCVGPGALASRVALRRCQRRVFGAAGPALDSVEIRTPRARRRTLAAADGMERTPRCAGLGSRGIESTQAYRPPTEQFELLKRRIFIAKAERVDATQLEFELPVPSVWRY